MTKSLILTLLLIVTGCAAPDGASPEEGIMRAFKQFEWGQTRIIKENEWQQNKPLSLVTKDPEFTDGYKGNERPFTKNVTLAATQDPGMGGTFALRWLVQFGVGGGQSSFYIDANSLQQFTISADMMRISLVSQYVGVTNDKGAPLGTDFGYSNPAGGNVEASVFYAEGTTSTDPPTLTQKFQIPVLANTITVPAPNFASTFRILGLNPTDNHGSANLGTPFTSNVYYELLDNLGNVIDSYLGDELYGIRLAPIPTGEAQSLRITGTDGANPTSGSIEWELDL